MEIKELGDKIKTGNPKGRYIFGGEEDYLKRYWAKELVKAAIGDTGDIFGYTVFDGEEVDFAALREELISPALMSEYKVIEWRFADFGAMKEKELEKLEELAKLQEENPDTVLIFTAAADGLEFSQGKNPSKLERRLGACYSLINFKKSTDRQLLGWLKRHFDSEGVSVSLDTLNLLLERSGRVMDVLVNEVQKLVSLAKARGKSEVSTDDVKEVASATPESEAFALQNAITSKDKAAAFTALDDLKFRRIDPGIVFSMVCRSFTELTNVAMLASDGDIAKAESVLGMPSFKVRICVSGAAKYGKERLASISAELSRLDAASKFGGITGYRLTEIFLSKWL